MVGLSGSGVLSSPGKVTGMTGEKTAREPGLTGPCCRTLQRMARDAAFESRSRALEGWRAEKAGEEREVSTIGAGAGGGGEGEREGARGRVRGSC